MIAWIKSWFWKPKEDPEEEPKEAKEPEKKKIALYPPSRYTLTPSRILEWWGQDLKLDALPPSPKQRPNFTIQ